MAVDTKTIQTQLITWADVTTGNQTISSVLAVTTTIAAMVYIHLARRSGSAFTAGWPNVRIEGSAKSANNDFWVPLFSVQMAVGSSIANTTLNGAVTAGSNSCVVAAATNISVGDILFLGHTTTPANYEIVRVKGVSGTTITFEENCLNAHDNGAAVTDQAELYAALIPLDGVTRLRAVLDNAGSGQTIAAEVSIITLDSFG